MKPVENRMIQLDGLRALAIAGVLVQHTTDVWSYAGAAPGQAGVWLFYCISGFLITGILLDARRRAEAVGVSRMSVWRAFWVRRALRIFPLYYLALACILIADRATRCARVWGWLVPFGENIGAALAWPELSSTGHLWSIGVEEQFYLCWPLLCLWLPGRWLPRAAVLGVLAAPAWRLMGAKLGWIDAAIMKPPFACLDGLGLGALLAITGRTPPGTAAVLGVALAVYGSVVELQHLGHGSYWVAKYLGYALASWWLVGRAARGFGGPIGRVLEWGPVRHVGRISYGVYLWHGMVPSFVWWWQYRLGVPLGMPAEIGVPRLLYVTAVSLGIASISWHVLERPMNELKRFFPYVSRRRPAEPRVPSRWEAGAVAWPGSPGGV